MRTKEMVSRAADAVSGEQYFGSSEEVREALMYVAHALSWSLGKEEDPAHPLLRKRMLRAVLRQSKKLSTKDLPGQMKFELTEKAE